MIFSRNPGRRWRHVFVCVAVFAALTACGGGTSQFDPFVAKRLIVFGDETSLINADGTKYSINAVTTVVNTDGSSTDSLDCVSQPIWVQQLASLYGFVFAECNLDQSQTPKAFMRAAAGAKVDDVQVQINSQLAEGGFRDKDLTTVLVGANDVIELYGQYPVRPEADLAAELGARGKRLAQQVNLLVSLGAKVIVSTVPDLGVTPYALKQNAEFNDSGRAELLSRLTSAFNEQLGVNILLDGRYIGLVQSDLRVKAMAQSPGSFGLSNVSEGACSPTVPPPVCTVHTLVNGADAGTWMWADDLNIGYSVHQSLAALAVDRARRNPF
jgi:phospholipase/lecithinase/hemolysin